MYNLELKNFILEHKDWEDILSQPPYALKISRDNGYIMFKYNQIESDFNIPLVREARGIIFRESDWKCVCWPFFKFFNSIEEHADEIDWTNVSVQAKIDGSLMKVWYDKVWHVSTNGTIHAEDAILNDSKYQNFLQLFRDAMPLNIDEWDIIAARNYTYMFELVSPYNRVVIPYDNTQLFLIGIRDNDTGCELNPELSVVADYFEIPKRYPMTTANEVVDAASKMDWTEEGFVVCDSNYKRVKIKSPQYLLAHYSRTNNIITNERLIQVVLDGEQSEFLTFADDYAEQLKLIEYKMHKIAQNSVEQMKILYQTEAEFINRGDYAKEVIKYPSYMKDFLFHCYDERIFWDYAKSWEVRNWIKAIEELDRIEEKEKEND